MCYGDGRLSDYHSEEPLPAMSTIRNTPFDQITIGQTARYSKRVGEREIALFAQACGDVNPVHIDADYAATTAFGGRIAHGMLTGALISAALAMELPGPGTVFLSQNLRFREPVMLGDLVTVELEVTDKRSRLRRVTLECTARNQAGKVVASGTAEVMAPAEALALPSPAMPVIHIAQDSAAPD